MNQSAELEPVLLRPLRPDSASAAARRARRPVPVLSPDIHSPLSRRVVPPTARLRFLTPSRWRAAGWVAGAVGSVLLVAFATQVSAVASAPLRETVGVGQEIRKLRGELADERAVNDQLREDIRYSLSRQGLEQEARKRGLVFPGEIALTITTPESVSSPVLASATSAAPAKSDFGSLSILDRARAVAESCLAILGSGQASH